MKTIYTNSDHELRLAFKDNEGAAIDLGNADSITVKVYQKRQTILGSYTIDNGVEITDAVNGKASVYVNRAQLTNVVSGKLFAEVVIDLDNENFADDIKRHVISDIVLADLKIAV